ncbi:unnamed protein product [Prorocentrum cordatum]|uniref:Uncharacterized protein n=1 Tax=Prorocentrum cordatum TaxID=2364126 RepID=A0ABN9SQH7_9DINO|nr:unnamed protein product [Polarella glacialis]
MSTTMVLRCSQPVSQPGFRVLAGPLATPVVASPVVAVHPAVTVRSAGRVEGLSLAESLAQQRRASPSQRDQALSALLGLLWERGALSALPVDGAGCLRVSSPFCHDYYEAPVLLPFLVDRLIEGGPGVKGIIAFGCDVNAQPRWWPAWEAWVAKHLGPRVALQLSQQDLSTSAPPPAGLVLGVHPEITNGGPWPAILAHVLSSCLPGGLCVFVTFYTQEAEEAARVCRGLGWSCEVLENPHYAGLPASTSGTYMRYAVLARAGGAGGDVRDSLTPLQLDTWVDDYSQHVSGHFREVVSKSVQFVLFAHGLSVQASQLADDLGVDAEAARRSVAAQ